MFLSTKSLPTKKTIVSTKSLLTNKSLVINENLIDENLSNMTEMSPSNYFWARKINHSQVVKAHKMKPSIILHALVK